MKTIICTVGTSLLSNRERTYGRGSSNKHNLLEWIKETSETYASAECNSLNKLQSKDSIKQGDHIVFLCSDTEDGLLCASVLQKHYSNKDFLTEVVTITGLKYDEKSFGNLGLKKLVDELISLIDKHRDKEKTPDSIMIIATGGFKAEIAYATLVGVVFKVPVLYIHDKFEDIITMPPIPLTIDLDLIAEYEEIFMKLDEMVPTDEWDKFLSNWVKREKELLPKEILNLVEQGDGLVFLSPAGEVYYKAYLDALYQVGNTTVFVNPKALSYLISRDSTQKSKYDRAMGKIKIKQGRAETLSITDLFVYPRGHCPERIFFFEKEKEFYICEIVSHSDQTYEKLLEKKFYQKDYAEFEEYILPPFM